MQKIKKAGLKKARQCKIKCMLSTLILHKNYTLFLNDYQIKIPLELNMQIPADDPVRLLSRFIEEMDLSCLYKTYKRIREDQPSPKQMLKLAIYGYMNGIYTSRKLETSCRRDINFMFLLEGKKVPDHTTIARFRSVHLAACEEELFSQMTEQLYQLGEITGKTIYIDGTKIEACANKYTFVWKKSVLKYQKKLFEKLPAFLALCEEAYGIQLDCQIQNGIDQLKDFKQKLCRVKNQEKIVFVYGSGKRKNPIQRSIETLESYIVRLEDYEEKLRICGDRNSYSKTDNDAVFMHLKEDAMRNGQLKASYNLQHGVDSEYITYLTISPRPTDTRTLIPFMQKMEEHLSFRYQNIVADAGYESEENYLFLEGNGQTSFIKPQNYEISKTRKYKNDIGRFDNMTYLEGEDAYLCREGRKLTIQGTKSEKTASGYVRKSTCYACADCSGCPVKADCIKGRNCKTPLEERNKRLTISKVFMQKRKENLERVISEQGCLLRMNRSIQAEGSFAQIKENMGFRRYLCRGKKNVLAESILVAMAYNMNKLHHKIQTGRTGTHQFELKNIA